MKKKNCQRLKTCLCLEPLVLLLDAMVVVVVVMVIITHSPVMVNKC